MKAKILLTALLGLFLMTGASMAETGWHTDWAEAAKESKKTNKPILIDFTGSDWCGWCIKLKEEVFDTPQFKKWAKDTVVLLEVDFPRGKKQSEAVKEKNKKLAMKYQIEGFPTIMFVDHTGKALGRYGYDEGGPDVWTKKAEDLIK